MKRILLRSLAPVAVAAAIGAGGAASTAAGFGPTVFAQPGVFAFESRAPSAPAYQFFSSRAPPAALQ